MERLFERRAEHRLIISPLALVEIESVLAIKMRTKQLDQTGREAAQDRLRVDLRERRILVSPQFDSDHFEYARIICRDYGVREGIRTLDALQLSMARHLLNSGMLHFLVAADKTLCRVASKMGIEVIGPEFPIQARQ
jgi:PIN domain